jgi:hypothetical protein
LAFFTFSDEKCVTRFLFLDVFLTVFVGDGIMQVLERPFNFTLSTLLIRSIKLPFSTPATMFHHMTKVNDQYMQFRSESRQSNHYMDPIYSREVTSTRVDFFDPVGPRYIKPVLVFNIAPI